MQEIQTLAAQIHSAVAKVIVGKEEAITLLLAALLARGHVLLEDMPGTGKTTMAKAFARALGLTFKRIQCTPDLLPSDVVGQSVFDQRTGGFTFRPGPLFTGLLLADEINRATPRSQSALLEAMQEGQVTSDGETYPLPKPFLVIATQNPIETQGTFPLPEAQLDRFLLKLPMGNPTGPEIDAILTRFVLHDPLEEIMPVTDAQTLARAQGLCQTVAVHPSVRAYIVALTLQTHKLEQVILGASPRAALALMRGAQALAAMQGRAFITPEDVKRLAHCTLAHRIMVRGSYGMADEAQEAIGQVLEQVAVPTEVDPRK